MTKTCPYVYLQGKKAGTVCGKNCRGVGCGQHVEKLNSESPYERSKICMDGDKKWYVIPKLLRRMQIKVKAVSDLGRLTGNVYEVVLDGNIHVRKSWTHTIRLRRHWGDLQFN